MRIPSIRITYLIGFIAICSMLGLVAYLQAFEGFNPCPLCILQRLTLGCLGVVFFLGALIQFKRTGQILVGLLAGIITCGGILLAGRQVFLQHFSHGIHTDCGASLDYMLRAFPLKEVLRNVLQGSAECTQVGWHFLSLSLADWSLCGFVILLVLTILQWVRAYRH